MLATTRRLGKGARRRVLTFLYSRGAQVECCYCGWTGSRFLPAGAQGKANRRCPTCGSIERYRMLKLYLLQEQTILKKVARLLDIAPKPIFTRFCRSLPDLKYISSDLMTEGAMVFSDLTSMGMAAESFDIINCLHVLEHIPNDLAAFAELGRLLKPEGFALLMVPLRGEKTFEDPTTQPADYERLFGQYDHVRYYGLDIVERIKSVGLKVEAIDMFAYFTPQELEHYALRGDDQFLFRISKGLS